MLDGSALLDGPVLPDYSGACVSNVTPALLQHADIGRGWLPDDVLAASQVVVLVLDGLGFDQLVERCRGCADATAMLDRSITTVAPSTTATALTSISTGSAPSEHGVIGYKIWVGGEVLNALRWSSAQGDARDRLDPAEVQPLVPFGGSAPVSSPRLSSVDTGFTEAHLRETQYTPYWLTSSIPVEIRAALVRGDRFVYAYYDGIDKVAHITGLTDHYEAELRAVDRLVSDIVDALPSGAALVVTADHGQVQVGESIIEIAPEVVDLTSQISGEARFVWLHAAGGRSSDVLAAATEAHGDVAWVVSVEQVIDEGWFGPSLSSPARARLGDVALVAHEPVALVDPARPGPLLQSRHGSLTRAEMLVPLMTAIA